MHSNRHFDRICLAVLICTVLLTVLFMNGESLGIQVVRDQDTDRDEGSVWFTENDLDGSWDTEGAVRITLEGSTASIEGSGAYVKGSDVVIASSGRYIVTGELKGGSLIVDAHNNSKVWILLSGVSLTCSDDAAIRIDQADKVFLTLAEGTENVVTSGETYSEEALSDNTGGAIFSHDDLTVNGSGSLTVSASYKHGIDANDDLVITGGTVVIEAPADGIHASDSLRICSADLTINAGDDGLATGEENAPLYMESGSVSITAGGDGIHSAGDITLAGGSLVISAGDDGIHSDTSFLITDGSVVINESYEGIEALTIDQQGGDISIVSSDDGFNANGGSFGQPGMGGFGGGRGENRGPGGTSAGTESREDTSGEQGAGEMPGSPPEADITDTEASAESSASDTWIHISGGSLTILNGTGRDADGLDSNGDILISGGTVRISLIGSGGNSAIDYNSEGGASCLITGGTVIACGASSMAEAFDESSAQCAVLLSLSEETEAGSLFDLLSEDGTSLLSWEVPYGFTSVSFSCPEMEKGESYTVLAGDQEESVTLTAMSTAAGTAGTGMSSGGMAGGFHDRGGSPSQDDTENQDASAAYEDPAGSSSSEFRREGARKGGGRSRDRETSFGESSAGEMPEMPGGQPPEMPDGEMPQMPDGEPPEMPDGEMPQKPQTPDQGTAGTEDGEDASLQDLPSDSQSPGMTGGKEAAGSGDTASFSGSGEAAEKTSSYDVETYLLSAASFIVLAVGLAAAMAFRRHR
ncbi:MAG: carbohydrate-binding domain-containing protein [Lachnospiraceae bacterium]|nr:carbohydrate-binding domain-containing protein [Lachnospiraceae bacterium]